MQVNASYLGRKRLYQQFPMEEGDFALKGHLTSLEMFLMVTIEGCYLWLKARGAAEHPIVHRTFTHNRVILSKTSIEPLRKNPKNMKVRNPKNIQRWMQGNNVVILI